MIPPSYAISTPLSSGRLFHRETSRVARCDAQRQEETAAGPSWLLGRARRSRSSLGLVHLSAALALVVTALPYGQAGAWLAHRLPERALRLAFAVLLVVTGVRMVLG